MNRKRLGSKTAQKNSIMPLFSAWVELLEKREDDIWIFQLQGKYSKNVVLDCIGAEKTKRGTKLYNARVFLL